MPSLPCTHRSSSTDKRTMDQPSRLAGLPLHPLAATGAGSTAGVTSKILPQFMESQQQSSWCWSAVATSVGLFFKTGSWTQCSTVNGCLSRSDCCTAPLPNPCNVYGYLDQSLTYTRSFDPPLIYGTVTEAELETRIGSGDPVCARVAWNGGGAHFVAITGYSYPDADPSSVTIYLQDSFYGSSSMAFADFAEGYHSGGTWTHTYLTTPNP